MPSRKLNEKTTATMIIQLCKALSYLHKLKIIHRDIKPENLLLDKKDNVKLADFGWSNFEERFKKRETYCGTIDYLAPEMADHSHKHDHRVDIWSIGVLIYELLTGNAPFAPTRPGGNNSDIEIETKRNILSQRFEFTRDFPALAKDLVKKILVLNPNDRPSIEQIVSHRWLTQFCENPFEKEATPTYYSSGNQINVPFGQYLKQTVELQDVHKEGGYIKNQYTFKPDELDRLVRPESVILRSDLNFNSPLSSPISPGSSGIGSFEKSKEFQYGSANSFLKLGSPMESNSSKKLISTTTTTVFTSPRGQNPYNLTSPSSSSNYLGKPEDTSVRSTSQNKSPLYVDLQPTLTKTPSRGNTPTKTGYAGITTASNLSSQTLKQGLAMPPTYVQSSQTLISGQYQSSAQKLSASPPLQSSSQPKSNVQTGYNLVPKPVQSSATTLQPPDKQLNNSNPGLLAQETTLGSPSEKSDNSLSQSKGRFSMDEWGRELLKAREKISELNQEVLAVY